MRKSPVIYAALPVMDEAELLHHSLACIESQTYQNFHVVACVNQPDEWWEMPEKQTVCINNAATLEMLESKNRENFTVIDKSSKGNGWRGNKNGVGWARKTVMDCIAQTANDSDIILSLDADTTFGKNYFASVVEIFSLKAGSVALANPYYHRLTGSEAEDRTILRYEIYMRNYAINLLNINSPYSFTALGSAIALPVISYKVVGGMTPKLSGEDFYFLQKLRKYGKIIVYNKEKVYPAARFSDRVFFGTGPAMIKGNKGDWRSYPLYHHSLFNRIKETYNFFPLLFKADCDTPLTPFMKEQFCTDNVWLPLRINNKDAVHFVRACHEKLDGLRILQFLKQEQGNIKLTDETCLINNITEAFISIRQFENINKLRNLDFGKSSVNLLDEIRNYLVKTEEILQERKGVCGF